MLVIDHSLKEDYKLDKTVLLFEPVLLRINGTKVITREHINKLYPFQ